MSRPRDPSDRRRVPRAVLRRAHELWLRGWKKIDICRQCGISKPTLDQWIDRWTRWRELCA